MKAKHFFAAAGMMCLLVCFATGCNNLNLPQFKDYDNTAVLADEHSTFSTYQQLIYIVNENSNTLLTAKNLNLSGIEKVVHVTASQDVKASLKCTFGSLKGSFKLIYASDAKATTIFDSDRQKSNDIVTASFPKGNGTIRLVGKPVRLENLAVTWENIDRSRLHLS